MNQNHTDVKNTQENLAKIISQLERPLECDRFDNPEGAKLLGRIHTVVYAEEDIDPQAREAILVLLADLQVTGYDQQKLLQEAQDLSNILGIHSQLEDSIPEPILTEEVEEEQ